MRDAAAQQGVEGVEPIAGQLRGELERAGLQVIDELDAPFDPNLHEAAMSEPGDEDQDGPVVTQVLRTGYARNGRVLRAAMVKVKGRASARCGKGQRVIWRRPGCDRGGEMAEPQRNGSRRTFTRCWVPRTPPRRRSRRRTASSPVSASRRQPG